jgi:hypothetical protein
VVTSYHIRHGAQEGTKAQRIISGIWKDVLDVIHREVAKAQRITPTCGRMYLDAIFTAKSQRIISGMWKDVFGRNLYRKGAKDYPNLWKDVSGRNLYREVAKDYFRYVEGCIWTQSLPRSHKGLFPVCGRMYLDVIFTAKSQRRKGLPQRVKGGIWT